MKKAFFIFAILTALTLTAAGQKLTGKYEFYEDGGKTAGGSAVFVGHSLEFAPDGTATLRADGFQTARDLICTYKSTAAKTMVYFASYNSNGVNSTEPYKAGELLLTIENRTIKGKKILWTNFGAYGPVVKNAAKGGGIYFKKTKD